MGTLGMAAHLYDLSDLSRALIEMGDRSSGGAEFEALKYFDLTMIPYRSSAYVALEYTCGTLPDFGHSKKLYGLFAANVRNLLWCDRIQRWVFQRARNELFPRAQ